jgi:hypothetical protein
MPLHLPHLPRVQLHESQEAVFRNIGWLSNASKQLLCWCKGRRGRACLPQWRDLSNAHDVAVERKVEDAQSIRPRPFTRSSQKLRGCRGTYRAALQWLQRW